MRLQVDIKRIAFCAVLLATSLVLSLVDMYISSIIAFLPGFKLGIANIVTLFALYSISKKETLIIIIARCALAALLAGNIYMMFFSVTGGVLSFCTMNVFKDKISIIKTSMLGGLTHNIAQLAVAALLSSTVGVFYYLPFLVIAGVLSGILTGAICKLLVKRIDVQTLLK